jgi:hypothetical protein
MKHQKGLFLLETPRGNFEVMAEFATDEEATKCNYGIAFTHNEFNVYTRHLDSEGRIGCCNFAVVRRDRQTDY